MSVICHHAAIPNADRAVCARREILDGRALGL
jgi:hypothetical protein